MTKHAQDTQQLIGTLLGEDVGRDAIHIAVAPAIAGKRLLPAQRVTVVNGKAMPAQDDSALGVVDPYLDVVMPGERFFIFLLPNTITSLRHAWTHPAFDDEGPNLDALDALRERQIAELWLRDFAGEWGFDYQHMVDTADGRDSDWIIAHGRDLHSADELGEDLARFWQNLAVLTGRSYDDMHKGSVNGRFSCSC